MIVLNLLPDSLKKKRKTELSGDNVFNIPQEIFVAVGGGICILLILADILSAGMLLTKYSQNKFYQSQWQRILPDKNAVDALSKEMRESKKTTKALEDIILGQGLAWSNQMNLISDSLPKGVWLTKISLNDKKLTIEGKAVSKTHNDMAQVTDFVANLKKNNDIMSQYQGFEIDTIQRGRIQSLDVTDFVLGAPLK